MGEDLEGPEEPPLWAVILRGALGAGVATLAGALVVEAFRRQREFARLVGARSLSGTLLGVLAFTLTLGAGYGAATRTRNLWQGALVLSSALLLGIFGGLYMGKLVSAGQEAALLQASRPFAKLTLGIAFTPALLVCLALMGALAFAERRGLGLRAEASAAALAGCAALAIAWPVVAIEHTLAVLLAAGLFPLGLRVGSTLTNSLSLRLNGFSPWPEAGTELRKFARDLWEESAHDPGDALGAEAPLRRRWRERRAALGRLSELWCALGLALLVGAFAYAILGLEDRGPGRGAALVGLVALALCLRYRRFELAALVALAYWLLSAGPRPRPQGVATVSGVVIVVCLLTAPWLQRARSARWRWVVGWGLLLLALSRFALYHRSLGTQTHADYVVFAAGLGLLLGLVPWRLVLACLGLLISLNSAFQGYWWELGGGLDALTNTGLLPYRAHPFWVGPLLLALALCKPKRAIQLRELGVMLLCGALVAFVGLRLLVTPATWLDSSDWLFRVPTLAVALGTLGAALGAWVHRRRLALGVTVFTLTLFALDSRRARLPDDELLLTQQTRGLLAQARGEGSPSAPEVGPENREAAYRLGLALRHGLYGPRWPVPEEVRGWRWIERAAEAGHPDAMLRLGVGLCLGRGRVRQLAVGREWIERAAAAGQAEAQRILETKDPAFSGRPSPPGR